MSFDIISFSKEVEMKLKKEREAIEAKKKWSAALEHHTKSLKVNKQSRRKLIIFSLILRNTLE